MTYEPDLDNAKHLYSSWDEDMNKTGNEIYAIVNKKELGEGKVCD